MKRTLLAVALVFALSCLYASEGSTLSLGGDLRGVDALFLDTLQARAEVRLRINDEFSFHIPCTFTADLRYNDIKLWEFGLFLDYHPFHNGFFLSVSLVQVGLFSGFDKGDEPLQYLNEVAFGYTWQVTPSLYLEPKLIVRDPSGVFKAEYALIQRYLPDYGQFRLFLLVGWEFLAIPAL